MDKSTNGIGEVTQELTAFRLISSVGITLLLTSERLFNECESIQAADALKISNELYTLSTVLASLCVQHDRRLEKFRVVLPEDIMSITIANPLFIDKDEKAHPF